MAKATRVHSTPRRTASKIKPGAPVNAFGNAARNEAFARAFVSLEPDICDLDRMAGLCLHLHDDGTGPREYLTLSLVHLVEMAGKFRKKYYAMYYEGRDASTDRKAVS